MKTIAEIRRENLTHAKKMAGGTFELLAEKTDTNPSYLSQISNLAIDPKTGKPRTMGNVTARKIEKGLKLLEGWMDSEHPDMGSMDSITLTTQAKAHNDFDEIPDTHVAIRDSQIRFAAGLGTEFIIEEDSGGGYALYRKEWLDEQGIASPDDLIRGINHGHSMANFIKDGARILIHLKDTEIDNDPESVYALRYDNQLRVKYVEKTDDGIILHSENTDFPDEHISAEMCSQYIQIIGRVIEVTNQTRRKKMLTRRK